MKRKGLFLLVVPFLSLLVSCGGEQTPTIEDDENQNQENNNQVGGDDSEETTKVEYLTDKSSGTATIKIFKTEESTSKERYISPKNVEISMTYNSLSGTLSNNENVCPSTGDVNLLVIPVHLPGSTYNTESVKTDIEKAFFGKDDPDNGYMSLSEYYYESSFGKLNFDGFVTDWFDVSEHTNVKSLSDITTGSTGTIQTEILRKATDWAFETYNLNRKDFDKNEDGSIDGIWMIYDHLNWSNYYALNPGTPEDDPNMNEAFWNYTSWDFGSEKNPDTLPNLKAPTTSGFSWASFDQLYSAYADYDETGYIPDFSNLDAIPLDSHTYIHETGHLLGLDDLYTSDQRRPTGSSTMMDQNIGDFDPYSKLVLGWVTPYVVYGSSEILLPYNTFNDHSVIVIPSNWEEISAKVENLSEEEKENYVYKFNPFSEYLVIDLYSPLGVNYEDTYGNEEGYFVANREACVADTGVRIFHVDSRIFVCTVVNSALGQHLYFNEDDPEWDGGPLEDNEAIITCISNERSEENSFGLKGYDFYERCRLIEAGGVNTFDLVDVPGVSQYASKDTFWNVDTKPFDIIDYGYQFFNGAYTYNDGSDLPFKVQVTSLVGVSYETK